MIIINRPQTDPYFNLAAEEYLIKNTTEPLFMLWQNASAVVIGKHQNALKEINLQFLQEKNIPVIRRISGGGTVYHDLGNLNYSFINFGARESLVNFKKYSAPILEVLHSMGVNAELVGKSDLKIKGFKFSGNASHVYKNKVLHHGTLLFSSELNTLNSSIQSKVNQFSDKAVASNRSAVTNIQSHLPIELSLQEFQNAIISHILDKFPDTTVRDFTAFELEAIYALAETKYKTWEWNFGYSPRYQYKGILTVRKTHYPFRLEIKNGKIESITFDAHTTDYLLEFQRIILGNLHQTNALTVLYDQHIDFFKSLKINKSNFLKALFGI